MTKTCWEVAQTSSSSIESARLNRSSIVVGNFFTRDLKNCVLRLMLRLKICRMTSIRRIQLEALLAWTVSWSPLASHFTVTWCFEGCLCSVFSKRNICSGYKGFWDVLKNVHRILQEAIEPRKSLTLQASQKDLSYQCIIPYVEGHELPEVHDVVKWVVCSFIHCEFRHYEPSRQFVVNNMGAEQCGEHVVQL